MYGEADESCGKQQQKTPKPENDRGATVESS